MRRNLCAYLQDILNATSAIQHFTKALTAETFSTNDLVRSAVERKFEIIGEALKQAAELFPDAMNSVPELKGAIGQRNWLAHGYFAIDPLILWHTLKDDLGTLVSSVQSLKEIHCT